MMEEALLRTLDKIVPVGGPVAERVRALRTTGARKIVFTNGCFDLVHGGHVACLTYARNLGALVVGMNSDKSVALLKGPTRPILPEAERARVLASFWFVDLVAIFDEPTPEKLIREICPDVLIKGSDYEGKEIAGADFVIRRGGVVLFAPHTGQSTSRIIEKIRTVAELEKP